ncbi:MAG: PorT family protein [Saprospiraceae bacterium]|nr:PorT family protein [Saprospiraceae bacterium]
MPQAAPETEQFERQLAPDFLALLPAFVTSNFEPKILAAITKIEVVKQRKWHLGLVASQLLNARPESGEQTRIGLRAGLVVRYDLPGNWYMSSGLQYQRRSGTFEATKLAAQRNYRFGLELDTLHLRPNSLHYLSLPVLLGWERSRHQFEAGLLLDFLSGVHGETGSYQKVGEPPVKRFEQDISGWISTDGYRRFTPTAQFGYRYRAFGKWSLGLTANYTFGGILDKNFEPPLGGFLLKESDKFYLGFQAVYFIK